MHDGVARVYADRWYWWRENSTFLRGHGGHIFTLEYDDAVGGYTDWHWALVRFHLSALKGRIPTRVSGRFYINSFNLNSGTGGRYSILASPNHVGIIAPYKIPSQGKTLVQGSSVGWVTIPNTDASYFSFKKSYAGIRIEGYVDNYGSGKSKELRVGIDTGLGETNKPYLDVEYKYATPRPINQFPASGFVNDKADKIFGWSIYADNIIGTMTQGAAKFRWRLAGTTAYTEIDISGTTNRYTIPANTFPSDGSDIEWQVQVQSTDGIWSNETRWRRLTTVDNISNAEPVFPANIYIEVDKEQVFTWKHIIDTGSAPSGAELQYRVNGTAWTDFASVMDSSAVCVAVPGNTLPAGNLQWRVRTYNSDGIAGTWSDSAAIVGKGTPAAPSITKVTSAARPHISWQSLGQIAYQLQILQSAAILYDTGETAGTEKLHAVAEYLTDGSYTVQIRIKNFDQLWSAWASLTFTIATAKPTVPTVSAVSVSGGAQITVTADKTVSKRYLLRNGEPIAKIAECYVDYAALGKTTYVVRAVGEDDSFSDSAPVSVTVTVPYSILAAADDLHHMVGLIAKRGDYPTHSGRQQLVGTAHHYAGRKFPLYTFSEFTEETFAPSYSYRNPKDWEKLNALISRRQTVLYRDRWGNRCYGVITGVDYDQNRICTDFTLSITRVDYVERIDYDAPEV